MKEKFNFVTIEKNNTGEETLIQSEVIGIRREREQFSCSFFLYGVVRIEIEI